MSNKSKEKIKYEIIESENGFLSTNNLFKKMHKDDTIINSLGPDSVLDYFPILQEDYVCLKANEYLELIQGRREMLICVFYRKDFSGINSSEFYNPLFRLYNEITPQLNKSKGLEEIYFYDCKFDELTDNKIMNTGPQEFPINIFYRQCKINKVLLNYFKIKPDIISNCNIYNFVQKGGSNFQAILKNNNINILETEADIVELDGINIDLYCHTFIENARIKFNDVKFNFNRQTLSKLENKNHGRFWNTFQYISGFRDASSQKETVEKYINYFKSRDFSLSKITRFVKSRLFDFHEGFTNLLNPSLIFVILLFTNYFILYYGLNKKEFALTLSFNVLKLYREIILNFFHFTYFTNINWFKVILFVTEPILFLSTLVLLITIRRKFSFKMDK